MRWARNTIKYLIMVMQIEDQFNKYEDVGVGPNLMFNLVITDLTPESNS
jgi:hypothetical protein